MKTEFERQARETEREPAVATPTRPEPLVLALQRGAGNQAVGRMIARLVKDKPKAHPVLQQGSRDPEVTRLQTRLNADGADPALDVSGTFDAPTKAAVIAFQGRHGLKTDGIVGIRTWGMVDELERRGLDGPQVTDLESTQPVTQEDHDAVEQILHPGHSGGGVTGPPMTDHEVGGKYETEVLAALDALYTDTVSALVKTPAVDMNHANRVSAAAQEEVEKFFGASITMASRKPTGEWHPGSSAMGLADASKRPMSQGDILGWTDYFMDNGSYAPAQIAAGLHYDGTRLDPDHKAHDRVRALWLNKHDGKRKASEMARAWPAEASTGTVFLQLRDAGYQNKVGMWDLFMTLVHEFMHLVTHPNYGNAADLIGGGGRDILIEGMDEHMSQQVWPAVRDRAFGDLALRTLVEGPFLNDPAPKAEDYADGSEIDKRIKGHVYDSMGDADAIAARVGEANVRAAYFMGHVEAIGIGAGSASETPLGTVGTWTAGGGGTPDSYVVPPAGETLQQVLDRTHGHEVEAAGSPVTDPAHAFSGGEKLKIIGVRWHTGIAEDTRGQVAGQHGITQAALERANDLPADKPTTPVAAGTLLLIPLS